MAELNEFVGVIPYSVYQDEPVALIWKHNYTSPTTRANTDFYTELIIRKCDEDESCPEAISRILSKISNGTFIKLSSSDNKNKQENKQKNINKCYNKLLSSIKKFNGVAILENNNGYKVYLIPVKFNKTKKLHLFINNNIYYKDCQWISFNKLLSAIYEVQDIQKMIVTNIENYKQKKNKKNNKKLTNYSECRLSLQFAAMLRNAHFRVIIPLFNELKITLNQDVMIEPKVEDEKNENDECEFKKIIIKNEKDESFIIQCKKCRVKLFTDLMITKHSLNVIESQCMMKPDVCNCIFMNSEDEEVLKLLSLMGNTSEMEGLLSCFKCKNKIGRFNYYGQKCSCNQWICPSFQVSVSKVDISRKRQRYFQTNSASYFVDGGNKEEEKRDDVVQEHDDGGDEEEEEDDVMANEEKPPIAYDDNNEKFHENVGVVNGV